MAWLNEARFSIVAGVRLGAAVGVMVAAAVTGCGRTELEDADPCLPTDTTRPCQGTCGPGTETCSGGKWRACVVPTTTRACEGPCGQGVQTCTNRKWLACEIPVASRACASACGGGTETCADGKWQPCNAPLPKPPKLHATIRDFHKSHPDFELPLQGDHTDLGIVQPILGADDKPVYAGNPTTDTTPSGAMTFNQWYRDVAGVNQATMQDLLLTDVAGGAEMFVYDAGNFFPIDGQLFGNEGNPHNYHFTLEAHTHFRYRGGETFSFSGDDDMWVFINHQLAINLGGVHATLSATVNLDNDARKLNIATGGDYQLDIFFAERHTTGSHFTIRTSIADASTCE
jgi:fibro-slime domain-containing protein